MLANISWQEYISCLLIATITYYFFIWIVFYKARISFLPGLSGLRNFSVQHSDEPDEVMTSVQFVLDEIRPLFEARRTKNELLFALQQHLEKYTHCDAPGFRDTIELFITQQSESVCSIRLCDDDLRALWR